MCELISTLKKKKAQAGNEWTNILQKSSHARKKPPPLPPPYLTEIFRTLNTIKSSDFYHVFNSISSTFPCADLIFITGKWSLNYHKSLKNFNVYQITFLYFFTEANVLIHMCMCSFISCTSFVIKEQCSILNKKNVLSHTTHLRRQVCLKWRDTLTEDV